MKFESISRNKDGNFYVIYYLPSPQKIHANCKGKRELLIYGFNKNKLKELWPTLLDQCDEE